MSTVGQNQQNIQRLIPAVFANKSHLRYLLFILEKGGTER